ncbi:MAG TPA: mechanosensitive ion channel domain-containing protein [Candidatus Acidoferrum sp.]|nr:mechanosensitive ion channel domain-containing protein [Candidatus Acidoferrum sp.]
MKNRTKIAAIVLVALLFATAYGLYQMRQPYVTTRLYLGALGNLQAESLVDQMPLKRAQQLAQLSLTPDEKPLADEALRLADFEVDLAFAVALHDAKEHPPVLKGEAKEIAARLEKAQKVLEDEQAQVAQLTDAVAKAKGVKKEPIQDSLDIAQEDLNLAQDEVDDAKQDLIRAGGDPEDRIQQMEEEHKAAEKTGVTAATNVAPPQYLSGLIHRYREWSLLRQKQQLLTWAQQAAEAAADDLAKKHDDLDAKIDAAKAAMPQLAHHAKNATEPRQDVRTQRSHDESSDLLQKTKQISADQKSLASFDKRVDANKQLVNIYGQWLNVVEGQRRNEIYLTLRGVLIILGIALVLLFFDRWLESLLGKTSLDRRQVETLRTVTRVSIQVLAVLLALLVMFGPPGQLGTFLGLAGAGLTVALKDFIVGFLGWFVLMGKNGIRLGDWVEINGVTGEVVELGMFHTVLLETGNWTDSGHPTGRRVTFTNSFAIEGHYFNFSTSGQWLWDELQVVLPAGRDPYPVVDAIQKKVLEATAETAKQAEKEWQGVARSKETAHTLTAAPAINVKPVVGGIEIAVRYITRANERYQLRAKLNQAAVDLLGQEAVAASPAASAEPASKPA